MLVAPHCRPHRITEEISSFQLIVHAELRLAYLYQYYSINKPFTSYHLKNRLFCQGRAEIQWERGGSRMKLITMLITMGEAKYDILLFFDIQE